MKQVEKELQAARTRDALVRLRKAVEEMDFHAHMEAQRFTAILRSHGIAARVEDRLKKVHTEHGTGLRRRHHVVLQEE